MKRWFDSVASKERRARLAWAVRLARVASLVQHLRDLGELSADLRDKLGGDYIFDEHYVAEGVDSALDHVERLLFDAIVLGADGGALAPIPEEARRSAPSFVPRAGRGGVEPEVAHLEEVVAWLGPPADAGTESVLGMAGRIVEQAFEAARKTEPPFVGALDLDLEGVGVVSVLDTGGGLAGEGEGAAGPGAVRCEPLQRLLVGALGAGAEPREQGVVAVINRFRLSLRASRGNDLVVLEAALTGREQLDWVFLSCEGDGPLAELPRAIAGQGALLGRGGRWALGAVGRTERDLTEVGRLLLAGEGPSMASVE